MQNLNSATSQEIILIHLFAELVCKIWHKNRLLPNNVDYIATDNLYGFTAFTCEQWPIYVQRKVCTQSSIDCGTPSADVFSWIMRRNACGQLIMFMSLPYTLHSLGYSDACLYIHCLHASIYVSNVPPQICEDETTFCSWRSQACQFMCAWIQV